MKLKIFPVNKPIHTLRIHGGFNAIYYLRDIKYIERMMRKLSKELGRKKNDIDWLQSIIETFLILNSRFYEDLILDLVSEIKKFRALPPEYTVKSKLKDYEHTLSSRYHKKKHNNRHRAAHGSNHQRVGIPEFQNDVLPKPINYVSTMSLANMAKRDDLIKMWQRDITECADDLNAAINGIIDELNTFENLPEINPYE